MFCDSSTVLRDWCCGSSDSISVTVCSGSSSGVSFLCVQSQSPNLCFGSSGTLCASSIDVPLPFSARVACLFAGILQLAALAKSSKCKSIGVVLPGYCGDGSAQALAQVSKIDWLPLGSRASGFFVSVVKLCVRASPRLAATAA